MDPLYESIKENTANYPTNQKTDANIPEFNSEATEVENVYTMNSIVPKFK